MTRQAKRSARIATLCVLGDPVQSISENLARLQLLRRAVDAIIDNPSWANLDALLLPGGYFWLARAIGNQDEKGRRAAIMRQSFAKAVCKQVRRLQRRSPGCLIVVGARARPADRNEYLEQVCIAFSCRTVAGIARKIFPAMSETIGRCQTIPRSTDFSSMLRMVRLPSGQVAALAACYDMFGISERPGIPTKRLAAIRVIKAGRHVTERAEPGFDQLRGRCLADWNHLLRISKPVVALAAIHAFERPGRDGFWQRHGIASASAALKGGLAVGAAHFSYSLPNPNSSTLSALAVPTAHLKAGLHRRARRHLPTETLAVSKHHEAVGLVRLFVARLSK